MASLAVSDDRMEHAARPAYNKPSMAELADVPDSNRIATTWGDSRVNEDFEGVLDALHLVILL